MFLECLLSAVLPDIPGRPDAIMFASPIATAIDWDRLQDAERSYVTPAMDKG